MKILSVLGCTDEELCLVFVSDRKMRELNKRYRQISKPTDVLSFSATEGDFPTPEENLLGDVVISVETASKQAKELGHTFNTEVERLLIHGILHLLGYDHIEAPERKKMKAKERRTIKNLTQKQ